MKSKRIRTAGYRYEYLLRRIYNCNKNEKTGFSEYFFNKCFDENSQKPKYSVQSLRNILEEAFSSNGWLYNNAMNSCYLFNVRGEMT